MNLKVFILVCLRGKGLLFQWILCVKMYKFTQVLMDPPFFVVVNYQ